ncbi:hypothetical protein [Kaistella montana]|uniref:DUF4251 domain-containing protein n=1 Tax=Kaistella montana TaxID=1849733 RepID=A0ABW5KB90_9FLAO|nr:hypothetical protein [Kaistella montana]MCQ4035665.1 hypothetical protein [Kaistella montana]
MKNFFFLSVVAFFAFLSCRSDDVEVQQIDQIIQLYIDSAGQDMLNTNLKNGYTNIKMNDVYGITDSAPVSFNQKKDTDTINYIEYLAGAKRIAIDSTASNKIYESKIALSMTKKINDSVNYSINDTMVVQYNSSPQLFQVAKVWYNGELKFTKVQDQPNIVKIVK